MSIGMTVEEFWHGDPFLAVLYRKAERQRAEAKNSELWLAGFYNFAAVSIALSNMHFDGRKHKVNKYLDKPADVFPKSAAELEAEQKERNQKIIDFLNGLKVTPREKKNEN